MIKKFKFNNEVSNIEVEETITDTARFTIKNELEYLIVSGDHGYNPDAIKPLFKALIVKHTTPIDVFSGSYDDVFRFVRENEKVIAEIEKMIDKDSMLYRSCLEGIEFRKNHFTGLQIYNLIDMIEQIANNDVITDEVIEKISGFSNAVKDLDAVEVAKMLAERSE